MQRDIDDSFISKHDSDTESNASTELDELNCARFEDSSLKYLTPYRSTRSQKRNIMGLGLLQEQNDDWRVLRTRTIKTQSIPDKDQKLKLLSSKYPRQIENTKRGTVSVKKSHQATSSKYQNLCSICLDKHSDFRGLLSCGHKFCFECIEEWTKASTRCPCCREIYSQIVKVTIQDKIQRKREIVKVESKQMYFNEMDYYICYGCDRGDDEDVLLICDMCQFYCCHVYCDRSLRNVMPEGDWFCRHCKLTLEETVRQARISGYQNVGRSDDKEPSQIRTETNSTISQNDIKGCSQTQKIGQIQVIRSQRLQNDNSQRLNQDQQRLKTSQKTNEPKRMTRAMNKKNFSPTQSELSSRFRQGLQKREHEEPNNYSDLVGGLMSTGMRLRNLRRRRA